ncbi:MAG: hypothetical protein F6K24_51655 [Okeania sp. SIO2D1]|uniref:hypothetical protein n=1 Tax=Okeania sp. SIO2C9 TaxID=2607791 RepID=UPI0013B63FFF|nr:hypothetical protein [Okeania sp. SIO2C9]NEQ77180.1 hypothetical protein [Okeania sp. SIO2C9]NES73067.1 hypothetical protein [Okeania sp. SIO2D1]
MKVTTTKTLFTATLTMFCAVSLSATPTKAQEKSVTNVTGSSEQLLSTSANTLPQNRSTSLTQQSTTRGRHGLSRNALDDVTNSINLQMQKSRDPKWKSEKQWFDEKWDSLSVEF